MKLVLDTDIYCDFAEGLPEVVETMAQYSEFLFLPSIVLGERSYGLMKGKRQQFNERKLRQLINRLKIEIIDVSADVARKYGMVFLSLEKKGARTLTHDAWIAACCMEVEKPF